MAALRGVPFDSLPIAALALREGRIVAVNAEYERFMFAPAADVVGRTIEDLIGQFVREPDVALISAANESYGEGKRPEGQLWIRVTDAVGHARSIRVEWQASVVPGEDVVYLLDAEAESSARNAAEGLGRAAGELWRCRDEQEVLERAAGVLRARGLTVATLLLRDGDPLLAYGPMLSTSSSGDPGAANPFRAVRPPREILWQLNPDFDYGRAAFFQDVRPLVAAAYPGEAGEHLRERVPQARTVQAPLFVGGAPYGALVITGDDLTPAHAGAMEMFAELVARAIENVRLRTELVQRERLAALGEAAAVMAHEVRNPIAAILNARVLLQKPSLPAGVGDDLLRVIGEEAQRLDRLVSDLLDLGRPLTPRIRAVDLQELAERSVAVLGDRGQAGEVEIVVSPAAAHVEARLDPDLTQLALWNVVRNAAQASPPGSRVTVAALARGDRAALVVDDQGPGFPDKDVERLLEPFHTTRPTGTGIGLAVVRRVVEACHGKIEIGASPGGGGRFVMVFPAGA